MGQIALKKKNYESALFYFDKGLDVNNEFIDLLFNKAVTLKLLKNFLSAEILFKKIIQIYPEFYAAYYNLALVQKNIDKIDNAIENFEKSISLNPNDFRSYYNLGNCFKIKNNFYESMKCYEKSLNINPNHYLSILNLGVSHYHLGNFEKSIYFLKIASKFEDVKDLALYNLSLAYLKTGNFSSGWKNYESRWNLNDKDFIVFKSIKPSFKGNFDKKCFFWSEQGIGDEVMFSSILKDFKNFKNKIYVSCDPRLKDIFTRSFPNIKFITDMKKMNSSLYEEHCSVGSLFKFFRNSLDKFSGDPYITPQVNLNLQRKIKLLNQEQKKIVGLSWLSKNKSYGKMRSISLSRIIESLDTQDLFFINLQYGDVSKEIFEVEQKYSIKIHSLNDNYNNLENLCYLISLCNKVITIDNSTVHFSGAIGSDAILLLPFYSDWRWQCNASKSYWYKSIKILNQKQKSDWNNVLKDLNYLVES